MVTTNHKMGVCLIPVYIYIYQNKITGHENQIRKVVVTVTGLVRLLLTMAAFHQTSEDTDIVCQEHMMI